MMAKKSIPLVVTAAGLLSLCLGFAPAPAGQENPETPLPLLWARCQETLPPFSFTVIKDEVVPSFTVPELKLRRIEVRFTSQVVGQWERRMTHTGIIHMPADSAKINAPDRKGKVVVIANAYGDSLIVDNYGEPIASRTGYPTMVLPIPGEYDGHDGESCWVYFLRSLLQDSRDPIDHQYFRFAVPYLSALDVFAEILHEKNIRAIIGGHSKRAPSAFNAAAMDPERVAGVVYMGMESTFAGYEDKEWRCISPVHSQATVRCPVLYLGATNEDGYEMFNITRLQAKMKIPWTVEYIPNYRHATCSEVQILDWQMWISHVFEGRPLTRITGLSFQETEEGTVFQARILSENKIIQTKVWYAYDDDEPYWRDIMWYPVYLRPAGEKYEALLPGKLPDAWLVEVKDIARGCVGYVSTTPQDITRKPTAERHSRGWRSRNWEPKLRTVKK
jgi:pimeloyl-ACP methyl ester carboxylesterase